MPRQRRRVQKAMEMTLVRGQHQNYVTLITHADGVRYRVGGVGRKFIIPHDLAHFIVEKTLNLTRGFWGSIADGGVFGSMAHVDGRRKPRAAERSNTVLKENAPWINESEYLVAIFTGLLEGGHTATSPVTRDRLKERWTPPGQPERRLSHEEVAGVLAALTHTLQQWEGMPVGGRVELTWHT